MCCLFSPQVITKGELVRAKFVKQQRVASKAQRLQRQQDIEGSRKYMADKDFEVRRCDMRYNPPRPRVFGYILCAPIYITLF